MKIFSIKREKTYGYRVVTTSIYLTLFGWPCKLIRQYRQRHVEIFWGWVATDDKLNGYPIYFPNQYRFE